VQPGATRFFQGKGATRLKDVSIQPKRSLLVQFVMENALFAPNWSKNAVLSENAWLGATGK
jgi:hypothetical protein